MIYGNGEGKMKLKSEFLRRWRLLELYDKNLVIFWSILSIYILLFHRNLELGLIKFFGHLLLIMLVLLVIPWMSRQKSMVWHFLRHWYIIMGLPFLYLDIGTLIHGIFPQIFDQYIINFEIWLFGISPNIWLQKFVQPVLTEILQISYSVYWITIPLGGAVFYFKKEYRHFEYLLYYVTITFFISYACFILFPVAGPRFALADQLVVTYQGICVGSSLRDFITIVGFRGGAFPSSHVGVALVILIYVWHFKPWLAICLFLPLVTALSCATIYGQYHYVTDVLAGVLMGLIIGFWGARRTDQKLSEVISYSDSPDDKSIKEEL
jgi:membrane-associated phospholipid phosphatase